MTLYRIHNWAKHYENNRTKELKKTAWVPVPNNHDSDGYTALLGRKNGAALFGAWIAMVQVASKCDPRGTLLRRPGLPHDPESLSRITRIPACFFEEAIQVTLRECNWLECVDLQIELQIPQSSAVIPQSSASRARARNGMEWNGKNGTEGNGKEDGQIDIFEVEGQKTGVISEPEPKDPTDDWIAELRVSPAYHGLNVDRELARMEVWCRAHKKPATKKRFIAWLNRCDVPINGAARPNPNAQF